MLTVYSSFLLFMFSGSLLRYVEIRDCYFKVLATNKHVMT